MTPRREDDSEVTLPFGVKLKGAVANQTGPVIRTAVIVAVIVGYYQTPLLEKVSAVDAKLTAAANEIKEVREDVKENRRDIRRLYTLRYSRVPDAEGTEITARPSAIAPIP